MRSRVVFGLLGLVVRWLPEPLLVMILPRRLRYDRSRQPIATAPSADTTLLISPTNFAGQGYRWARAVEALPGVGAVSSAMPELAGFGFPLDVPIDRLSYIYSKSWQNGQRRAIIDGFTHVIVEAERRPYGRPYGSTVVGQVRDLVNHGVKVAMLCHGSDIRLPSRHLEHEPDSPFRPGAWDSTPMLEEGARQNRAILDTLALPVFVATPDLLRDVPEGIWLPIMVDPMVWRRKGAPLFEGERPVVVHAPSVSAIKGTDLIEPTLIEMDAAGEIEYRRLRGVPNEQMPEMFRTADIVLEQFRLGSYGVTALEAMAAGCVVIGHVDEFVRDVVASASGLEVPIVESRGADIGATLRAVIADHKRHVGEASRRVAFVEAVHDGRTSAEVLRPFLTLDGAHDE